MKFEVFLEILHSLVNSSCGSSSNGDIVDEDRDNEANTISGIDIHRGIRFEASESKGFKCGMKLLVPKSTCLFETIKGLLKTNAANAKTILIVAMHTVGAKVST